MEVKKEGAGYCGRCHSPLMTLAGGGSVCMACEEAAKPKTGRTIVVTGETGQGTDGVVMGHEVPHTFGADGPVTTKPHPTVPNVAQSKHDGKIHLTFTLADLDQPNILLVIMQALYDGIDNLPPPATLKETKKAIATQNIIEAQIKKLKGDK